MPQQTAKKPKAKKIVLKKPAPTKLKAKKDEKRVITTTLLRKLGFKAESSGEEYNMIDVAYAVADYFGVPTEGKDWYQLFPNWASKSDFNEDLEPAMIKAHLLVGS